MPTALVVPLLAGVIATALALYLAPILIAAALRYGIVDKPKPPLKLQTEPVPYLGGMVVFLAFLSSLAITFRFDQQVLAILLASSIIVSVGLIDDLGTLTPKDKFIGQLVASFVLVKAGVRTDIVLFPDAVDYGLSMLWMVTCMNAFNILDVSDGLATTAGLVGSLGAVVIAISNGEPMIAAMGAALAGACLGFLRVNRQPARMYLGDTGSMFLGAVLGALAMIGRYSEQNAVSSWFVPLALLAVPLFDLGLVVLARLIARKPVYHGSPDHFAVRLRHHGWSARKTARTTGVIAFVVTTIAIASTFLANLYALIFLGIIVAVAITLTVILLVRFPPKPKPQPTAAAAEPVPSVPSQLA